MSTIPTETTEYIWLTPAAAARVLSVSRASIWRWSHAGSLPSRRIGPRALRIGVPRELYESARLLADEGKGGAR
jgi:predicted DNA-binding transcriptional regulator AlpA